MSVSSHPGTDEPAGTLTMVSAETAGIVATRPVAIIVSIKKNVVVFVVNFIDVLIHGKNKDFCKNIGKLPSTRFI